MTSAPATPQPTRQTFSQALAAAVIDDWKSRPRLRKSGQPFIKTIILEVHLGREAEAELDALLGAAGLVFDCNQIYQGGRIQRQTNIIHVRRADPE